jgi:hypothetical protein
LLLLSHGLPSSTILSAIPPRMIQPSSSLISFLFFLNYNNNYKQKNKEWNEMKNEVMLCGIFNLGNAFITCKKNTYSFFRYW